jgi:hypothetical protein
MKPCLTTTSATVHNNDGSSTTRSTNYCTSVGQPGHLQHFVDCDFTCSGDCRQRPAQYKYTAKAALARQRKSSSKRRSKAQRRTQCHHATAHAGLP